MTSFVRCRSSRIFATVGACLTLLLAACGVPVTAQPPATATHTGVATPVPATAGAAEAYPATTDSPPAESIPPTSTALLPMVLNPSAPELGFSGERAMEHVAAQMQHVPRHTGTSGWQATGDYIIDQLEAAGWEVEEQRFPYRDVEVRNIIGKRGSGPMLILGAHYDTRKYADRDPDPRRRQDPVPGANDAASGVAVLLELAQHIDSEQLGREVWLAFFDAEDNGDIEGWDWIVGSTYMAENLPRQPEAMILVDMIGDADLQIYYEQNSTATLRESIWQTAGELGYDQFIPTPKYAMLDDHTPFLARGIPAVDLIDFDYPPWHTVDDTIDKLSAESLEAVGRTLERWLDTRARP